VKGPGRGGFSSRGSERARGFGGRLSEAGLGRGLRRARRLRMAFEPSSRRSGSRPRGRRSR